MSKHPPSLNVRKHGELCRMVYASLIMPKFMTSPRGKTTARQLSNFLRAKEPSYAL